MPEFILDTSGEVAEPKWERPPMLTAGRPLTWRDLDAFTHGYIEALFFTSGEEPGTLQLEDGKERLDRLDYHTVHVGFSDLASETLLHILKDCAAFQATPAWKAVTINLCWAPLAQMVDPERRAGRDFWYTRNGHGCGFWDGDWPEPYATTLTASSEAFREVDVYLGDDGLVYLS